jgi:glyoxylase-like metal-dependent hydrolase (beta-lactamase superfamily II)
MRPSLCLTASFLLTASIAFAQAPDFREEYRLGLEAAKTKDYAAYATHMEKALELNTRAINRPELMYHVARAAAFAGRPAEAVKQLDRLWDDGVESLMVSYAEIDPAFEAARKTPEWKRLMTKVEALELKSIELAPGIWMLDGAGCALIASVGDDGVLLVDTGYPRASNAVVAALRTKGEAKPLRFVVNTHHHDDHVGGNLAFNSATIVAHPKTREEMTKEQTFMEGVVVPPKPARALPRLLVDAPTTIHFNGDEVLMLPLPSHSPGDLVIVFRHAAVVHMGDNYFPGVSTLLAPGTEIDAYMTTMRRVTRDLPDDARVVTGHSPVAPGRELKTIFAKTEKLYELVRAGIDAGESLESLKEEGAEMGYAPPWVEHFYENLKKK